jgi:hypothetical protein
MNIESIILPSSLETGMLGICHLKRFWTIALGKRNGSIGGNSYIDDWRLDKAVLFSLGLGLEQTIKFVYNQAPDFEAFEQWILEVNNNQIDPTCVEAFNRLVQSGTFPATNNPQTKMITPAQQQCWDENGYLIIPAVINKADCDKTIEIICETIDIIQDEPSSWYKSHPLLQGIMVQLFQHPQLEKNRHNEVIRTVYEELWGRTDLIVTADRVGFNPPETDNWRFPGPSMHWDISLELPIPFGLQGILYLSDTAANQGAFSLLPGFHHRIESWLRDLPPDANPRRMALDNPGIQPIAANAGDFILWHHALPHGSSPNSSVKPRFVQYFTWEPADFKENPVWK